MDSPFKFKVNQMVWFLSNNQVSFGSVVDVHYKSSLKEGFLRYKVKLTTQHNEYSGEEKKESELFESRGDLIAHLSSVKELQ